VGPLKSQAQALSVTQRYRKSRGQKGRKSRSGQNGLIGWRIEQRPDERRSRAPCTTPARRQRDRHRSRPPRRPAAILLFALQVAPFGARPWGEEVFQSLENYPDQRQAIATQLGVNKNTIHHDLRNCSTVEQSKQAKTASNPKGPGALVSLGTMPNFRGPFGRNGQCRRRVYHQRPLRGAARCHSSRSEYRMFCR
jgi:hypothetical protein